MKQYDIFREDATKHYLKRQQEAILPHLLQPSIFFYLWLLIGLAVIAIVFISFVKVPKYVTGTAVITGLNDAVLEGEPAFILLLPAQAGADLQPGQKVLIHFNRIERPLIRTIQSIDLRTESSMAIEELLEFDTDELMNSLEGPQVIATTSLRPVTDGLPSTANEGLSYQANVEIGTQQLVHLLPFVDRFFLIGRHD